MNAVENKDAISTLVGQHFNPSGLPFTFLEAFDNKPTTIKRLRTGTSIEFNLGGTLKTGNIHTSLYTEGETRKALAALKAILPTAKTKFALATDGPELEAENLNSGKTISSSYAGAPIYFGFFLLLAAISSVKKIRESLLGIRAACRLNKLYTGMLNHCPEWGIAEHRHNRQQKLPAWFNPQSLFGIGGYYVLA